MKHIPNLILHHYTSGNGVLGIVESDSIWATSIHHMNDSKEFSYAIELAGNCLKGIANQTTDNLEKEFCRIIQSHLDSAAGLALYIACFSEVEDSLNQWRGYCPPSFGYSIGFDGIRLKTIGKEQGFELRKCIYDRIEQEKIVRDWAKKSIERLKANYNGKDSIAMYCRSEGDFLLQTFIVFAPCLKHISFKDEKEWRLVSMIQTNDSRTQLRSGNAQLIPYIQLKLNLANEKHLVFNARVGPTPHIELALKSMALLFNKVHFSHGIAITSIPYRDW